jgi:hypothetical protein
VVTNGQTFRTNHCVAGLYEFYIQPVRYGCEYLSELGEYRCFWRLLQLTENKYDPEFLFGE